MIERAFSVFDRVVGAEPTRFHPVDVLSKYKEINSGVVPEYIEKMIMLYPNWRHEILTPREVGRLIWYFDKENPNHISWKLTQGGKNRRVEQVARVYLSFKPESLASKWKEASVIEGHIETLKRGGRLPPLIIVKGRRYPDNPDSSFIDGVHRALAIVVWDMMTPGNNLEVDAFVGRKASLAIRAMRRAGLRVDSLNLK